MPLLRLFVSKVIDSRPAGKALLSAGARVPDLPARFTTYEIMERLPLVVIKRDGSRQTFDKNSW
jgi:transcriptional repressor NrdR